MATFPTNPAPNPLDGTEIVPITQGGVDKRTTAGDIVKLATAVETGYDNTASGLVAGTVQAAIDELAAGGGGSGDVVGPASSANSSVALFSGTTGKLLKDGGPLAAIATSGSVGDLTGFPGGTANFLRADGTFAAPAGGGGGGSGDVVGPGSATDGAVALFDGTTGKLLKAGSTIATIRSIPQNSKSVDYTLVLADAGGHIYHPGADTAARAWTIPANASVAYPIGTALTFVNDSGAGVVTIAITSDTLVLAGAGTTGSRTLAANGVATAIKITSTRWLINGTGLT